MSAKTSKGQGDTSAGACGKNNRNLWMLAWDFICVATLFAALFIIFDLLFEMDQVGMLQFESKDTTVAVLGSLVTAATVLGVVVTAVAAVIAKDTRDKQEVLTEELREIIKNADVRVNDMLQRFKDFDTPENIENKVFLRTAEHLKQLNSEYEPASQIKKDVVAMVERDLYAKIISEYRSALQSTRWRRH